MPAPAPGATLTPVRSAPLALLSLVAMTHAQEPTTTLRFEASGSMPVVQVDPALGVLVQTLRYEGASQVWTRTGAGRLLEAGRAWEPDEVMPPAFATADGELWAPASHTDAMALRRWDGRAWRPVELEETPAVGAQRRLRRGAVQLGVAERIRAADGSEYLLDGFGVLARGPAGAWRYGNLQPLEAPPMRWSQVHWEPRGEAVLVATEAGRGLLGRGGALEEVDAQQDRPRPAAARVQLASGAWVLCGDRSVVVLLPSGEVKEHEVSQPRPVARRPAGDLLLVQARGYPTRLVAIDGRGALVELEQGELLETPDPRNTGVDASGAVWWWTRGVLRRWDAEGRFAATSTGCAFLGIDPDQRAWFASPAGVVASLALAELERELVRAPEPQETTEVLNRAARLDPEGRLRVVRAVAGQPEQPFAARHQRRVYRWHVREGGAWVVDPDSPEWEVRFCALHWCEECHGGARDRPLPAPLKLETRPLGGLDPEGRALALDSRRDPVRDDAPLIRRPDGSTWLLGPTGLTELEPLEGGRWRPRRNQLAGVPAGPWVQTAEGEVWVVGEQGLGRVAFPR